MVATGVTCDFTFFIWSVFLINVAKTGATAGATGTYERFWKIMSWSLEWLMKGRWPTHDWKGKPYLPGTIAHRLAHETVWLAGGYFGMLFSLQGDLDYYNKSLGLESHTRTTTSPCIFCPASTGVLDWRDFRPNAGWLPFIYTIESWLEIHPEHLPIFDLWFVSIHTVTADYMHIKYLGVDQYFYASMLWMLVFKLMPFGTPAANMTKLWDLIEAKYAEYKTPERFVHITMNMFANKDNPKLKGKAAEVRHLGKPLLAAWTKWSDTDNIFHRRVGLALKLNIEMEDILSRTPGNKLPPPKATEFVKKSVEFLCLYSQCADHAAEEEYEAFDITIKGHYLYHSALDSKHIHPKKVWNFSGEDFMKHSKRLLSECTRSIKPWDVVHKFVDKYLFALNLNDASHSRWFRA